MKLGSIKKNIKDSKNKIKNIEQKFSKDKENLIYETIFYQNGIKIEKDYLNRKINKYYKSGNLKYELYFLSSVPLEKVKKMLHLNFFTEDLFGNFYFDNNQLFKEIIPLNNKTEINY